MGEQRLGSIVGCKGIAEAGAVGDATAFAAEFLPQTGDMDIDAAVVDQSIVGPHCHHDFLTAEVVVWLLCHEAENHEFAPCEDNIFAVGGYVALAHVDGKAAGMEKEVRGGIVLWGWVRGAFQYGFYAGEDGIERERFGDVVVGTAIKACQLVVVAVAGGEEDDWGVVAGGTEVTCHVEAGHVLHHDVKEDKVERRRIGGQANEGFFCAGACGYVEPFVGEVKAKDFA